MMPHVLGTGIRCPRCQGDENGVRDSRPSGNMIRRRRRCAKCDHRFSTFEAYVYDEVPLLAFRAMQLRSQMDGLRPEQREAVQLIIDLFGSKNSKPMDDQPEIPNLSAP
jgi:transcription repressor NrdR-like protein